MDLYHPNPTTLGRLLTKRQNPCTQIFKAQPSNPNNVPMSTINLARNDISASHDEKSVHFSVQNSTPNFFAPNSNFQSPIQTSPENPSNPAQSADSTSIVDEDDDDAAPSCYEKVEKKLKTATFVTTELRSRRNSSFEEEKEESDHSTSCETRSDFFNACETGDTTPFSPPMTHQPHNAPSDLKLDSHEGNLRSCGLNCNFNSQDNAKKAQEIAQTIGENLCNLMAGGSKKVRCKLNHQWDIDLSNISKKGCPRCSDLLEECREFARKNQGSCLNEEYDETIRYRCIKGHIWSLNYKNARRRWCAQCAKEQRAFMKKKCEEEKLEREKQDEAYQNKLFEEARRKAMQDNAPKQPSASAGQSAGNGNANKSMSLLEYFQRIDYEIESLAKKYTIKFMEQKEFAGELNYQQILQVYKISIMPEEVLQTYMSNLTIDTLKAEFRRMAKIIHPDKNKHPQAGNAFQKIYKVYEVALSRLEGTQQKI